MTEQRNKSTWRRALGVLAIVLLAATAFTGTACGDSADEETNNGVSNNDVHRTAEGLSIQIPPGVTINNDGSDFIDTTSSDCGAEDPTGWCYDEGHSSVRWETAYHGKHALMTGQFGTSQIDIRFDQNDLENSSVQAAVQLSSVFTGEPGRDNLGGCLMGSFGVEVEQNTDGEWAIADESTDVATFTSKTVEKRGDGYVAVGTLDFKGVQSDVELEFAYTGIDEIDAHGGPIDEAGFIGEFTFKANSIFGVDSSSINDNVTVLIDAQFAKPAQ